MLKALLLMGLGFGVMLGIVSKKKAAKVIGGLIFMPVLLLFAWSLIAAVWAELTALEKLGVIVGAVVVLFSWLLFFTAFGREVLASIIGDFLYDKLKSLFGRRR